MKNNPVLFLDIDGVLNHQLYDMSKGEHEYWSIDPNSIGILNNFLAEFPNMEIVISSIWRLHGLDHVNDILIEKGLAKKAIDITPRVNSRGSLRGNEIYLWIKDNRDYDFTKYVIFDDDSDMLLWQANNYFRVDSYCGLTPNICYRASRFLKSI